MYKSKKPYLYGTGRRKSSVARVHLFPNGTGAITINGRDIDDYFGLETLKLLVRQPLATTDTLGKVDIVATVTGGGVTGQAGAVTHDYVITYDTVVRYVRAGLEQAIIANPRFFPFTGSYADRYKFTEYRPVTDDKVTFFSVIF